MYLAFLQIHTRYIPRYRGTHTHTHTGGKEVKILRTLYNSPHFWVKAEVTKLRSHDASVREPEPGPRRPPSRARSCRSDRTASAARRSAVRRSATSCSAAGGSAARGSAV